MRIRGYQYIQNFISRTRLLCVLVLFFNLNLRLLQAHNANGSKQNTVQIHLVGEVKLIEYKAVSVKPKQNLKKSKKLVFKKKKVKRQRPIIQHNTTCFIKKTPQSTSIYSVMGKVYNKVAYNIQILFLFLCCLLALLFLFDLVLKGFKRYSYVFIDKLKTYSLYSRPPTFSY